MYYKGARSLVRLERPAHNRVAKGSNPFGPTINPFLLDGHLQKLKIISISCCVTPFLSSWRSLWSLR